MVYIYMKAKDLISKLREMDSKGVYVFTRADLEKMFHEEDVLTIESSLARHVKSGFLTKACKGIYVNPNSVHLGSSTIEDIAQALRPGEFNYVSLETVLSNHAVISQIMIDRITVMTTGAKGTYETPWGTIEFTHTKRSRSELLARTEFEPGMAIRYATKQAAYRDLLRVGRNVHMVDLEELEEEQEGA